MLDIPKTYEQYSKIKNKELIKGLNTIFTAEALTQYVILQHLAFKKDKGTTLELISSVTPISEEYIVEILNELIKNKFVICNEDRYIITDQGKNFVIVSYLYNLENQFM